MNRDAFRAVVLAACCLFAIALAAGMLSSPTSVGGDGGGFGASDGDDLGTGESEEDDSVFGFGSEPITIGPVLTLDLCYPFLLRSDFLGALGVLFLSVWGTLAYLRDPLVVTAFMFLAFMILLVAIGVLTIGCDWDSEDAIDTENMTSELNFSLAESGDGSLDDGNGDGRSAPAFVLVFLLVLALGGALGVFYALGRADEGSPEVVEEGSHPGRDDPSARLGEVAGDVADELESTAQLENAVYRAWLEMTDALDVDDPESSTPAEFANAAVEAGMSRSDVSELTALFEEVRYGDYEVTAEREQQALDALRRIEATYATDGEQQ